MAWLATVRVKLSSEAAGAISVTPVVMQDLTPRELIEHVLAVTEKDQVRIREILRRGTLVSGASRFRWEGWEAGAGELGEVLAAFRDPRSLPAIFDRRCLRAVLRDPRQAIEVSREAGCRKGWFGRRSFWDTLMALREPPLFSAATRIRTAATAIFGNTPGMRGSGSSARVPRSGRGSCGSGFERRRFWRPSSTRRSGIPARVMRIRREE